MVEGSSLEVTFLLGKNLKRYPLSQVILDTSGKDYDIRFGGNRAYAEKGKTGCITCLESCWVGITSNARYPYIGSLHRFLKPNSHFKLNPELKSLLKEGPIYIEYKLK